MQHFNSLIVIINFLCIIIILLWLATSHMTITEIVIIMIDIRAVLIFKKINTEWKSTNKLKSYNIEFIDN